MDMGWGILMMVAMLVLVAVVIVGAIWLLLRLAGNRERVTGAARAPALDVLDRRYAAGEIDADEYRERRSTLEREG